MSEKKNSEVLDFRDWVFQLGKAPDKGRGRLYEFTKEDKFVDVVLTFDDGTKIPCHRYVFLRILAHGHFDIAVHVKTAGLNFVGTE